MGGVVPIAVGGVGLREEMLQQRTQDEASWDSALSASAFQKTPSIDHLLSQSRLWFQVF